MKNIILLFLTVTLSIVYSNTLLAQDSGIKKERKKLKLEIHTERRVLHHDRKDHHEKKLHERHERKKLDKKDRKELRERRRDRFRRN